MKNFSDPSITIKDLEDAFQETSQSKTQKMKQWIDNATYEELLRKNRFAAIGDEYFQGDMGRYYLQVMATKKQQAGNAAHVAASKSIGW